jgi:hypothetical protein
LAGNGAIAVTRLSKKAQERFFVEEAACRLGKNWIVGPDREQPDFVVTEEAHQFGLEVSEIFTGPQDSSGAAMKQVESQAQRVVNSLRNEYEATTNIPLTVKFVGNMRTENFAAVVPTLIAMDLASKEIGYYAVLDEGKGLRVHVTKGFRVDWYSVNHRVGWVDLRPQQQIKQAIEKKSKELSSYVSAAGSDIRLMLVANRFNNSGKLRLQETATFDLRGFSVVYFFSFPETVTVFDQVADAA